MSMRLDLQTLVRNTPWALEWAWKFRGPLRLQGKLQLRRVVEPDDDIVVEGYPRSSNTFATEALILAQPREIRIGKHFHSPAQFFLARKYGVPAMLLLREPVAAALSWVVFSDGAYSARETLQNYVRFHRKLPAIRDSFIVAPFDEVTANFDRTIVRLNAKFGTSFALLGHNQETESRVFEIIKERDSRREAILGRNIEHRVHYPSQLKAERRAKFVSRFDDPSLAELKAEATKQYETLLATL